MNRLLRLTIASIFVISTGVQAQTPDLEGVKILTTHVSGNIYMLEATGDVAGNIGVSAGSDGILIVDTQFALLSDQIITALKKISSGQIKFIINTHYHDDHTDGNKILGKFATIIAHTNTRKHLLEKSGSGLPTITFDKQISIYFNGEEIKVIHYSHGHTDSDVVVLFTKSNVVHLGDLLNSGIWSFPTVDIEGGGNVLGMLKNVEKLLKLIPENAKIIPGHYGLSDMKGLKTCHDMLVETIGIVQRKKAAGMNLEQIKKEGFPAKYNSWGKGYTNAQEWIENIFFSLEDINTKKNMPEDVLKVQKKAKKVYLNEKGFWEAEFKDKIIMVYIPEGEFPMGSDNGLDNEKPVHKVYLDGYWLSKFPLTVSQFKKFINDTGYITDAENGQGSWQWWKSDWVIRLDGNWKNPYYKQGDSHPVVSVSWNDANEYCKWLSHRTGLNFKLPTAAQWEKGARGTDERMYPWGNEKPDGTKANYADINYWNKYEGARHPDKNIDDGFTETSPVGNYPAGTSPSGLLDMAGNVWEWCHDIYDKSYYSVSPYRNPLGPPDTGKADQVRVNRGGGSWTDRSGYLTPAGGHNLRSAARTGDEQNSSDDHMGFRLCIDNILR